MRRLWQQQQRRKRPPGNPKPLTRHHRNHISNPCGGVNKTRAFKRCEPNARGGRCNEHGDDPINGARTHVARWHRGITPAIKSHQDVLPRPCRPACRHHCMPRLPICLPAYLQLCRPRCMHNWRPPCMRTWCGTNNQHANVCECARRGRSMFRHPLVRANHCRQTTC